MSSPSLALQAAIVLLLKNSNGVLTLVSSRVYDSVPANPTFPYIALGDGQELGDDSECADGSEVFFQIHAWSRAPGFPESKSIASAIRTAMKTQITLTGYSVIVTQYQQTQFLKDPDGLTRHAMVEYRFIITHS